jgi:RimJ/RimL family protein N-acetyltransferase
LDDVISMFADAGARRFYPEMEEPNNNRRWIEWNLENYREFGFGLWVIEDSKTGEFLGDCGITYQPVEGEQLLEIGYHLVEPYRGRGLVTEAARACLSYGFEVIRAEKICSLVHPENVPSQGVARRLHDFEGTYLKPDGTERLIFWSEAPSDDGHSSALSGL